jgi:hypothetical protein
MTLHPKVVAQSTVALITGVITAILVAAVPAFHKGLPADVQALIPLAVALVLGLAAGYVKKSPDLVRTITYVKPPEPTKPGPGGNAYG